MSVQPARSAPEHRVLEGRTVRLEPLEPRHAAALFALSTAPGEPERHRWLSKHPPAVLADTAAWIDKVNAGADRYAAVIERQSGRLLGHQGWLRIRPEHGSIEIGGVYWGLPMARTALATEAFYLFARHAFDDLGYRRFEWKCDDRNTGSKAAASRFGFSFEGLFRQDRIAKGENRDTAWFSMLDSEWPARRAELERWLAPDNFDGDGRQKTRLTMG